MAESRGKSFLKISKSVFRVVKREEVRTSEAYDGITRQGLEDLSARHDATGMFANAIKATDTERQALLLPEHKHLSRQTLTRPRSTSCSTPAAWEPDIDYVEPRTIRSHSESQLIVPPLPPLPTVFAEKHIVSSHPGSEVDLWPRAWSKYPSHTRSERVQSFRETDGIKMKDFAPFEYSGERTRDASKSPRFWRRKMLKVDGSWLGSGGRRSSVSVGRSSDEPELEMPENVWVVE